MNLTHEICHLRGTYGMGRLAKSCDEMAFVPQTSTTQIFTRLAVEGASPEEVARAFGIERNAVDQIMSRAMARLRGSERALGEVGDARLDT